MRTLSALFALLIISLALVAVALAEEGDLLWQNHYGGTDQDWGYDLAVTTDGGFILAGYTRSMGHGGRDVYLVKLDAAGDVEWDRALGTAAHDNAWAVIQTSDGGYLTAGNLNIGSDYTKDGQLIKVDADGNEQWQMTYGGSSQDEFFSVVECAGGGYAMAGTTTSIGPGGHAAWIVRVDAGGTMLWQKAVALAGHGSDYLYALVETEGGDLVAAGYSGDGNTFPTYDAELAKFDDEGNLYWVRHFDDSDYDRAYDLTLVPDGGYAMVGPSQYAMTIWRINESGFVDWTQRFNTITNDTALGVLAAADGGILVCGDTYNYDDGGYQVYVGKTDGGGNALWDRLYGGAGSEGGYALAMTPGGDYAVTGTTSSGNAGSDDLLLLLIEGADDVTDVEEAHASTPLAASLGAHPNPFNPNTEISFRLDAPATVAVAIFDTNGRRLRTLTGAETLPAGRHELIWDGKDDTGRALGSGVYFVRVQAGSQQAARKLVMIK